MAPLCSVRPPASRPLHWLAIGSLVFLSMPMKAQFHLGPTAGMNVATIDLDTDTLSVDPRFGLLGGLAMDIGISRGLSIGIEPRFIEKGWRLDYYVFQATGASVHIEESVILKFIEAPILLRVNAGGDDNKLLIEGGFCLGYWAGVLAKARTGKGDWEVRHSEAIPLEDEPVNRVEWSLCTGIGGAFKTSSGWAHVLVRYQWGVTDLDDTGEGSITTKGLQATLAYLFELSAKEGGP